MRPTALGAALLAAQLAHLAAPPTLAAAPTDRCTPAAASHDPHAEAVALLDRALEQAGALWSADVALHYRAADVVQHPYESDRSYPPFLSYVYARDVWVSPASGVTRITSQMTGPSSGPVPMPTVLAGTRASWVVRDTAVRPAPGMQPATDAERPLGAWMVLRDWRLSPDVRPAGRCFYRDYWRTALARTGPGGEERLLLDPKSGLPVRYERREPHYLWGDVRAEYVYTTWIAAAGGHLPSATFRLVDGEVEISRTVGDAAAVPLDSAPPLALPDTAADMRGGVPAFLRPTPPDTVRVGESAYLLVNPGYTNAVVLANDTVYVLDAQQGEARARQDSLWVGRLFPGRHPVALVVTDVAWPHVAGVRFWVAAGATVVSHRASRALLERVVARRWTLSPDLLERRRAAARLRFRAVDDSLRLAGGRLSLYAIDGVASEGALMAYLGADRFLYAGDYVQTVRAPSQYAQEVRAAVHRVGIAPERVAAQHLPVTAWSTVERAAGG